MITVNKTVSVSAVDYAAEELKKYLRMMLLDCGEIKVKYDSNAKDGFILGLMQDFGLDISDAEEPELDDVIYIDADGDGGIIAGDNPRSVLLAVYEYLRRQGCRWLFPGVDGEFIPVKKSLEPLKYRYKPSCRYRGQCNEGAEFQSDMIEAIDFTAKVGLNIFMLEFFIPAVYYRRYYNHEQNEANRKPEPVTPETILQWRRQCEAEIAKRGLMFHNIGHGWSGQSFGIDTSVRAKTPEIAAENDARVTDEQRAYLALVNGERKLWKGVPDWTQFCMSNPAARRKVAEFVSEYAEKHSHSDYLHVWLGDLTNNHCECAACREKTPSDWYVILLNEIDEVLTSKGLDTRIAFIVYSETIWAPEKEILKNPKRFALLFAPITREYSHSLTAPDAPVKVTPYIRNKNVQPTDFSELFQDFKNWTEHSNGSPCLSYEYHFWKNQLYDVGGISLARVINGDIKFYKEHGINGVIEDGSQRAFFPTGLAFYTYARTLFDTSLTADEIAEEYFSCAFGEDWKSFYSYLEKLGATFDHAYVSGEKNAASHIGAWYDPEHVASLKKVRAVTDAGRKLIAEHYNSPYRVRTVSARILEFHADYADMFSDFLMAKAVGKDALAYDLYCKMRDECGKYELAFERWYDHFNCFEYVGYIANTPTGEIDTDPDAALITR